MRFAFAIVSLFQGGGLQRDCLGIARLVRAHGHEVTLFTGRITAPLGVAPDDIVVTQVDCDAWTNHGRNLHFANAFRQIAAGRFNKLIGFDKLLDLDVLYCADPSVAARLNVHPVLRFLPRYRVLSRLEGNSFAPGAPTRLMLVSEPQASAYRQAWNTEPDRVVLLPPSISAASRRPYFRTDGTREKTRAALGLDAAASVWLAICMQPNTKGLDRAIDALVYFPGARLVVVGTGAANPKAVEFVRRAQNAGVADRVQWLGYRDDIPELMAAADILVHPARYDTTGTVILEAVVNGLPVVTTAVCGFASHVATAKAGIVIPEPFRPEGFHAALAEAQNPAALRMWSSAGAAYGEQDNLYQGWAHAAALIMQPN